MKYILAGILMLVAVAAFAQMRGTTEDGRAVLLNEDGTWQYAAGDTAETSFHFRRARWGMSADDVKASETSAPVTEDSSEIVYDGTLADLKCRIAYSFAQGKLVAAAYRITEQHENKNVFLGDYNGLKELLTSKYGKPKPSKTRWLIDQYKDTPRHWGLAVSMGHMTQFSHWKTDDTTVDLTLEGRDFKTRLAVEYASTVLSEAARSDQKAKLLRDF